MMPQQKEAGTIRVQQPPRAVVHAHANQHDPEASSPASRQAAPQDKTRRVQPISRVRGFIGMATTLISGILFGSAITYYIRCNCV